MYPLRRRSSGRRERGCQACDALHQSCHQRILHRARLLVQERRSLAVVLAILAVSLAGCGGQTPLTAPSAADAWSTASAVVRATNPAVAVAERAIRLAIEKRIPDYFVRLKGLVVTPSARSGLCMFSAEEEVSGLGGSKRFKLHGSFDARGAAVRVLHRESLP